MNEIILDNCTPVPLASYLKALGVLRLLTGKDPDLRGYWNDAHFVLCTRLERSDIEDFLLYEYKPTPILAPWNGGSGFYARDNKNALDSIKNSQDPRLSPYQKSLGVAEEVLEGMNRDNPPEVAEKFTLQRRMRALLPDEALPWFDAAVTLNGESAKYPPLLGTGGNDGRLDFTNNFMQRLLDALAIGPKANAGDARRWLEAALFAQTSPGLMKSAIGQFSPGQVGGPNATSGFKAESLMNPWDFVLMIEGTLVFASAVVRRHANDPASVMSFPFTVRAVTAGSPTLGEGDAVKARGEIWLPLWREPAGETEIRVVLAEGRVALGRKSARDALDFVRAVHHLGGYRGINSFQRYSLLMRSGKAYLATPTGRISIHERPVSNWLDELDAHGWLDRYRRFARSDQAAGSFRRLCRRLEDSLFALSGRTPRPAEIQSLLILLGEIQSTLARSDKARVEVPPLPCLTETWVARADDGTPAFRMARALAGLQGFDDQPLPLRAQLFPVHRRESQWLTPEAGERLRFYTPSRGRLTDTLTDFLQRRLWLAEKLEMRDKPLESPAGVTLDDLDAFLRDPGMDARIAALLPGLALCRIPQDTDHAPGEVNLPAAFGLLKLALTPDCTLRHLGWLEGTEHLPVPTGMLEQLSGRRADRAVQTAWRRLRASRLAPLFPANDLPKLAGIEPRRAAAALVIPLCFGAVGRIARQCLHAAQTETA